ncbi:RagB/SusD family nutrient uptake outer membrane protein [Maribacter sp. LLG6340-A2]|uniref:RagB/SusD family nutrient uptake outer membrane protein n=1 Tax=Maribacter sp. LLG6340-A2 TaxID=3160834 RepID=UPI00386B25BA
MKNFNYSTSIFVLILCIFSVGCEDELYQEPTTQVLSSSFYSNESEIETAVTAIYAGLQNGDLYGTYLPAIGEVPSDNTFEEVPANDGGNYSSMDEFSVTTNNGIIAAIWEQSYIVIQRANIVLNRIEEVAYNDDATKNARIGESKFLRALTYFNLVRIYGDVPLVTIETTDPFAFFGQGRTDVNEVYAQIELDLTEAISVLPTTGSDSSRVTKGAAQALLGKVYLTRKNYSAAKTQFSAMINSYTLVPNVANIFGVENENNSEVIFAIQFASGLNGNSEGSNALQQFTPSGTVSGAKGHNLPNDELLSLYDADDLRLEAYFQLHPNSPLYYTNKLTANEDNQADGGSDWIVLRYSDIVLSLAEVENELQGGSSTAISLLNSIRTRAGLPETTATTQEELREAIALERRLELSLEGQRWFDLLRTDKAIEVLSSKGKTISENDLLMPIPQNQLDADPTLEQNPGY